MCDDYYDPDEFIQYEVRIDDLEDINADLLEALSEAIEWDGCDEDGVDAVWLRQAQAAIAKAKGETK